MNPGTGKPQTGNNDWSLIEDLFHGALERPSHERSAWLAQRCPDSRIREEVESLLDSLQMQDELPREAEPPDDPPLLPGDRFGEFELLRLLGRGGMGAVYLAHSAAEKDKGFEHKVALKVLASHLAGEEFLKKFQSERRHLASLSHTHITQLYSSGVSSSGSPYLVMEYVDGETLDRYCDARKLPIEERLRLFLQVCEAVEFAHRNLIVHRDLKPGNILVNGEGAVKLLDFGTAALIADQESSTVTATRMLTPRYSCPERMRGGRAHPSHDIFSLGVILYELLVGAWPFGDPASVVVELQRASGDSEPTPPSGAVTEEAAHARAVPLDRLRRILQGDLSAMTLKAIENDPERRYATVRELADDVRSFLAGRPVLARPQTTLYRVGKFLRRNWIPMAAAAILVAGLSVAAVVVFMQVRIARAEARKSEKVSQFLNQMLSSAGRSAPDAKRLTVAQMLDHALVTLESSWKDDPATETALRISLGNSYRALFELDKSKAQFQKALEISQRRGDPAGSANAMLGLGMVAASVGASEESVQDLRSSLDTFRQMGRSAPLEESTQARLNLAEELCLHLHRSFDEVNSLVDEALVLCRRDPSAMRLQEGYAYFVQGSALGEQGKLAEADKAELRSLEILRLVPDSDQLAGRAVYELLILKSRGHDLKAAAAYARQYYELNRASLGADSPAAVDARFMMDRFRSDTGDAAAAAQDALDSLPALRKVYPPLSANLWNSITNTAHCLVMAKRFQEAEPLAREEVAIMADPSYGKADPRRGESLFDLAEALEGQKKNREAAEVFTHAAENYEGSGPTYANRAKAARSHAATLKK